ncbi:nucleotidyltransferase domain-containing protein [Chloroflexota bacterium]
MKTKILQALENIETDEQVKIIYACESGSRAWGFASTDSDYDVRFIYLRPVNWYLSINLERKRDVIEILIDEGLDISGWDLRKALQLFRKSNPPLLEWLGSPTVYLDKFSIAGRMRALAPSCYSPIACMYHYYKMASGNFRDFLRGDQVWVKKYFYVLRPVLAVIWLERDLGVVPTPFQELVDGLIEPGPLKDAVDRLIRKKRAGQELDRGPRDALISQFLENEIARMEAEEFEKRVGHCPVDQLDELFRQALEIVWAT